jgi:hypothetical protein
MKNVLLRNRSRNWILVLSLLFPLLCSAAQFVDLTVQMEINDWDYWLFEDRRSPAGTTGGRGSIFTKAATVHCVIGANTWLMEGNFYRNSTARRWFTGTNIIEQSVITQELPEGEMKRLAQVSKLAMSSPPVGQKTRRIYDTGDGNPGRPVRVSDLMDLRGRICWLALCSGSVLQRQGRQLFPPSDLWKELLSAPGGFSDKTTVFDDGLGLPRSIELFAPEQRCIFQYQVRQTTNIVGWEIPLEFYGVQYRPARTNGWELQMTFKGKVSAIGVCSELKPPEMKEGEIAR